MPKPSLWGMEAFGMPIPRHLVADRDWRHHDREFRGHGRVAGLDGTSRIPGIEAHVVRRRPDGTFEVIDSTRRVSGEIALQAGWPSMFSGYLES